MRPATVGSVQRFQSIETLVPQKAVGYGEPVRRVAQMARAGLPVPPGFALSREHVDGMIAAAKVTSIASLLDGWERSEGAGRACAARATWLARPLDASMQDALRAVAAQLEGDGARAFVLTTVLACNKSECERTLGGVRLGIDGHAGLVACVREGIGSLFDPVLLDELAARGVRDAGVSLLIQRMVDGLVSGVAFTRHPVTGNAREWLVRAGYGLASRVRQGDVASDVVRVTRDGFVRDLVIREKASRFVALADGSRALVAVPSGLRAQPALTESLLPVVLRLAMGVERHLGGPVNVEWALQDGRVHLLHAELLPVERKAARERSVARRDDVLWSQQELGEALPDPLPPLTWSLLRRFSRVGLADALSAGGAAFSGEPSDLTLDVRGRAYLNLSAVTDAVCRIPGITPRALLALQIEIGDAHESDTMGALDLLRAALRFTDTQVRFVRRLPRVAAAVSRERTHFAGIDTRLLSPDAVERMLCDVEAWLRESGLSLMRCYGLWVTGLLALRAICVRYYGDEALRLERDLLWGPGEVLPSGSAVAMLALARSLSQDSRARAWADGDATAPEFVREALLELTLKHRHEAPSWLDPASPRLSETAPRLLGALRVLLSDPMALAISVDREALVHGRRERAEREWKRRIPMLLWPVTQVLITRVRTLTRQREELLVDAARAITVLREVALDASRRLAMREPSLGAEGAFFLNLDELHAMLRSGQWDVRARIEQRRIELGITASLPPGPQRFVGRPRATAAPTRLTGKGGSGGAAEGRVVRVVDGSELATLPHAAVLVVRSCDVGLGPFMPCVRAVIAESGGMLSHGAMLANALGVPAVVGLEGALSQFVDGERVRVDGDRACVERLGATP